MILGLGVYLITARVKAQDFARHPLTPGFIGGWWAMDPAPAVRVQCPLQSSRALSGPLGPGHEPRWVERPSKGRMPFGVGVGVGSAPPGPPVFKGRRAGKLSLELALSWVTVQHNVFCIPCDNAFLFGGNDM